MIRFIPSPTQLSINKCTQIGFHIFNLDEKDKIIYFKHICHMIFIHMEIEVEFQIFSNIFFGT